MNRLQVDVTLFWHRYIIGIALLLLLFCPALAQKDSTYLNFSADELKANPEFVKHFSLQKPDLNLLKECIRQTINIARVKYENFDTLREEVVLDSAAQFQADYQAKWSRTGGKNYGGVSTAGKRNVRYDGSRYVEEVTGRIKASRGNEVYPYMDLAVDFVKHILSNRKNAAIMLKKKFTLIGIGLAFDENMAGIYYSIVFGNYRSLNDNNRNRKELEVPYSSFHFLLQFPDQVECRKCNNEKGLELLYNGLDVANGVVTFEHSNLKQIRKLLGSSSDGFAIDIIQEGQYQCGADNIVNNNKINRGVLRKPVFWESIEKASLKEDPKGKNVLVELGEIPEEITGDYEVNLLVIKSRRVCRTLIKNNIIVDYPYDLDLAKRHTQRLMLRLGGEAVDVAAMNEQQLYVLLDSLSGLDLNPALCIDAAQAYLTLADYEAAMKVLSKKIDATDEEDYIFLYLNLHAMREDWYLTNTFYDMAKRAKAKNPQRFCNEARKFSLQVLENKEFKAFFCETCR